MQQQTRQRQRRQRQSTPLPEKRGRTGQATRRRHANTTLRHMVNHPPPFQQKKGEARGKTRSERKARNRRHERGQDNKKIRWCSGITCVLAKLRAHYPEHQQQRGGKDRKRKTNNKTTHPHTLPPHPRHSTTQHNKTTHTTLKHTPQHIKSRQRTVNTTRPSTPHKPSPLFHNDTTLSQKHSTKPTML